MCKKSIKLNFVKRLSAVYTIKTLKVIYELISVHILAKYRERVITRYFQLLPLATLATTPFHQSQRGILQISQSVSSFVKRTTVHSADKSRDLPLDGHM